jgi:hypothetical protein
VRDTTAAPAEYRVSQCQVGKGIQQSIIPLDAAERPSMFALECRLPLGSNWFNSKRNLRLGARYRPLYVNAGFAARESEQSGSVTHLPIQISRL